MSVPQSLSVVQGPGSHVETETEAPVPPPTSVALQSAASGGQGAGVGALMTVDDWQVYPCAQSASLPQLGGVVVANARPAKPAELSITKARRGLLIDMVDLSRWRCGCRRARGTRRDAGVPLCVLLCFQQNSCHRRCRIPAWNPATSTGWSGAVSWRQIEFLRL